MVYRLDVMDVVFSELKKGFVEENPQEDVFLERVGNSISLSNKGEKLSVLNLPGGRFYLNLESRKDPAHSVFYSPAKKIIREITGGGAIFCN